MRLIVISAPFEPERRASAMRYAIESGIPFEIMDGVDGDKLDATQVSRNAAGFKFSPRVIACYLSHIQALERFLETDDDRVLIVEDDWMIVRPIREAIECVPRCDFITLHGLDFPAAPLRIRCFGNGWQRLMPPPIINLAYVVNRLFAKKALAEAFPITEHVDHFYRNLCIKYNLLCYRPTPAAVIGAGFKSTLGHD